MAMIEKKVPYEVNGRQFEGKLVYDDSVKAQAPAGLHAAGLEGHRRRHHRPGA